MLIYFNLTHEQSAILVKKHYFPYIFIHLGYLEIFMSV